MMSPEQFESVASCAAVWSATITLCAAGFQITARHRGYENVHVVTYTELYQHRFPAEMLCDTIRHVSVRLAEKATSYQNHVRQQ